MARKPSIAIVGAGNVGRVLALALHTAGFKVCEIISRSHAPSRKRATAIAELVAARAMTHENAVIDADVILICVTDDAIAKTASALAKGREWKGKVAMHTSGALASSELKALKARGCAIGSCHPMNTFVAASKPEIAGTPFTLEGDLKAVCAGEDITRVLDCPSFRIRADQKVLYHAMGSFCSPLLVSLLEIAERTARKAGIRNPRSVMDKIFHQTVENYFANGAAAAFSGPINRGNLATVRKHLAALAKVPHAKNVYLELARNAVDNLPVKNKTQLKKI